MRSLGSTTQGRKQLSKLFMAGDPSRSLSQYGAKLLSRLLAFAHSGLGCRTADKNITVRPGQFQRAVKELDRRKSRLEGDLREPVRDL
jgi:hypothetical protein